MINEGSEPSGFWQALGGKQKYLKFEHEPVETTKSPPRLYRREENSMEEIRNFEQKVLNIIHSMLRQLKVKLQNLKARLLYGERVCFKGFEYILHQILD